MNKNQNENSKKITVSIGEKVIDIVDISGELIEPPKYDMKEVLRYAIRGIDKEIEWCVDFGVSQTGDKISHLLQLRKTLLQELEELSGNGKIEP